MAPHRDAFLSGPVMQRKHIFLACFAMFALATLVLANAYRAKAGTPSFASVSQSDAPTTTAVALCPDQLLVKAAPGLAAPNAKGRKTGCGL